MTGLDWQSQPMKLHEKSISFHRNTMRTLREQVELTEQETGDWHCLMVKESVLHAIPVRLSVTCKLVKQPLFTDFTFDNLGAPKNPDNPFYDMDEVYLDNGEAINPLGDEMD